MITQHVLPKAENVVCVLAVRLHDKFEGTELFEKKVIIVSV